MQQIERELRRLALGPGGPARIRRLYASFQSRKAVDFPDKKKVSLLLSRVARIEKYLVERYQGARISAYPTYEFVLSLPETSPRDREAILKGLNSSFQLEDWSWSTTKTGWDLSFSVK